MKCPPIGIDGILSWSTKRAGSICWNTSSLFVIANEAHLSSLITIPDQLHHATKMSRRDWASLVLFDRITASSANWSHAHSFVECLGPQIYPRLTRFDFFESAHQCVKTQIEQKWRTGISLQDAFFDANRIRPLVICRDRYGTITVDAVE